MTDKYHKNRYQIQGAEVRGCGCRNPCGGGNFKQVMERFLDFNTVGLWQVEKKNLSGERN